MYYVNLNMIFSLLNLNPSHAKTRLITVYLIVKYLGNFVKHCECTYFIFMRSMRYLMPTVLFFYKNYFIEMDEPIY